MPSVVASINLPVELWEKSKRYKLNRSAIARTAITLEIDRIENEEKAQMIAPTAKKTRSPDCTHSIQEVQHEFRRTG
jgi:post-segregation antitoxin (ccd killing protein)